jgi:hypothetical protein
VNGLALDRDALAFVHLTNGQLFTLPIAADGSPGALRTVALDTSLAGGDGLQRVAPGRFVVVQNGFAPPELSRRVVLVDVPASGVGKVTTIASGLDFPTTLAIYDDNAWVVEAQLDHLFGQDPTPARLPFVVERVGLPAEAFRPTP